MKGFKVQPFSVCGLRRCPRCCIPAVLAQRPAPCWIWLPASPWRSSRWRSAISPCLLGGRPRGSFQGPFFSLALPWPLWPFRERIRWWKIFLSLCPMPFNYINVKKKNKQQQQKGTGHSPVSKELFLESTFSWKAVSEQMCTHTHSSIFYLLLYTLDAHNSSGWARWRSGARGRTGSPTCEIPVLPCT